VVKTKIIQKLGQIFDDEQLWSVLISQRIAHSKNKIDFRSDLTISQCTHLSI